MAQTGAQPGAWASGVRRAWRTTRWLRARPPLATRPSPRVATRAPPAAPRAPPAAPRAKRAIRLPARRWWRLKRPARVYVAARCEPPAQCHVCSAPAVQSGTIRSGRCAAGGSRSFFRMPAVQRGGSARRAGGARDNRRRRRGSGHSPAPGLRASAPAGGRCPGRRSFCGDWRCPRRRSPVLRSRSDSASGRRRPAATSGAARGPA